MTSSAESTILRYFNLARDWLFDLPVWGKVVLIVAVAWLIFLIIFAIRQSILNSRQRKEEWQNFCAFVDGARVISAQEFLAYDQQRSGRRKVTNLNDFTGVYVIFNVTKQLYYVGQSKTVFKRLRAHLNGKGNGDVYADFVYGDYFTVKTIPLADSGYGNLDALERDVISYYDAYNNGYNRNSGNSY